MADNMIDSFWVEMAWQIMHGERSLDEFTGKTRLGIEATIQQIKGKEG